MKTRRSILINLSFAGTLICHAFCLCAFSQDISLGIAPAVHITWASTTNKAYQIQSSTNLPDAWLPQGDLLEGTGGQLGAYFDTAAAGQFFRVEETAASGVNWLEGTWQGDTYQASSNSIPFTTRLSITNSNRSFSGIYSNSFVSCRGTLELLSYSDTQARFYSRVLAGPCVDGLLILTRVNTTNVLYNWYHPNGPTVASSFAVLIHK
jgi:hypothetical protein